MRQFLLVTLLFTAVISLIILVCTPGMGWKFLAGINLLFVFRTHMWMRRRLLDVPCIPLEHEVQRPLVDLRPQALLRRSTMLIVLLMSACRQAAPVAMSPDTHQQCLALKQPVEGQIYGVSNIWDQKGGRYALVTEVSEINELTGPEGRTTKFTYNEETTGVLKIEKTIPLTREHKVTLLQLENGRWRFKD